MAVHMVEVNEKGVVVGYSKDLRDVVIEFQGLNPTEESVSIHPDDARAMAKALCACADICDRGRDN